MTSFVHRVSLLQKLDVNFQHLHPGAKSGSEPAQGKKHKQSTSISKKKPNEIADMLTKDYSEKTLLHSEMFQLLLEKERAKNKGLSDTIRELLTKVDRLSISKRRLQRKLKAQGIEKNDLILLQFLKDISSESDVKSLKERRRISLSNSVNGISSAFNYNNARGENNQLYVPDSIIVETDESNIDIETFLTIEQQIQKGYLVKKGTKEMFKESDLERGITLRNETSKKNLVSVINNEKLNEIKRKKRATGTIKSKIMQRSKQMTDSKLRASVQLKSHEIEGIRNSIHLELNYASLESLHKKEEDNYISQCDDLIKITNACLSNDHSFDRNLNDVLKTPLDHSGLNLLDISNGRSLLNDSNPEMIDGNLSEVEQLLKDNDVTNDISQVLIDDIYRSRGSKLIKSSEGYHKELPEGLKGEVNIKILEKNKSEKMLSSANAASELRERNTSHLFASTGILSPRDQSKPQILSNFAKPKANINLKIDTILDDKPEKRRTESKSLLKSNRKDNDAKGEPKSATISRVRNSISSLREPKTFSKKREQEDKKVNNAETDSIDSSLTGSQIFSTFDNGRQSSKQSSKLKTPIKRDMSENKNEIHSKEAQDKVNVTPTSSNRSIRQPRMVNGQTAMRQSLIYPEIPPLLSPKENGLSDEKKERTNSRADSKTNKLGELRRNLGNKTLRTQVVKKINLA